MGKVQPKIIQLEKLLLVEPYRIIGLWSNGETRINNFSAEVEEWRKGNVKELKKLANAKTFKTAFVKNGTLAFKGSTVNIPGMLEDQPVDFDRRTLYSDSELIGRVVSLEAAIQHNQKCLTRRSRKTGPDDAAKAKTIEIDHIIKGIGPKITPLFVLDGKLIEVE